MKMRKWILALAGLLISASAQAHVSAVPFPEIGALQDAHKAAFSIVQTYLPPATSQITCNMATGVASVNSPCTTPPSLGTCNGDVQTVTRTTSINSASPTLNVSTSTFTVGDVGKTIIVPGAGSGGDSLTATILASPAPTATQVTLSANASTTLSSVSTALIYGNDDTPVFAAFNVWALANQSTNQVVQNFAASSSCWFGTQVGGGQIKWVAGIKNLLVEGNSSTLDALTIPFYAGDAAAGTGSSICHKGLTDVAGCTARIQTVSAGSSTIQLTGASLAAGYISRFSAVAGATGNWILVAGLNSQAVLNPNSSGYPPSATYFEWRQITAINVGTGVITLNSPLTYAYLDTWPNYSSGNSGEADAGGPGTIYAMGANWNTTVEYKNLTIKTLGQLNGSGRNVIWRNVSFAGSTPQGPTNNCGAFASMNDSWSAINSNWGPCTIESDKLAVNMTLDTVTANRVDFQSTAITNFTASNSNLTSLIGTARINTITDTTIGTLKPGSTAYGNSSKFVCTRCTVTTLDTTGGVSQGTLSDYSKVGSVLQFLNSANTGTAPPSRIFAPVGASNSHVMYIVAGSFSGPIGMMNVSALTQDATNTYAQTSDTVAFPPPFTSGSGAVCCSQIQAHPAPQFTNDTPDIASDPTFYAMSVQNGATPLAPFAQFSKRSFTPSASGILGTMLTMGRLVSITIDVTVASTHSGAITLSPLEQFNNETVNQSTWAPYSWALSINLKQAGKRVITPSGTTCDTGGGPVGGACAGDTCTTPASGCYTPPAAVWFKSAIRPTAGGGFSGGVNPQFTITIQTDQGVVP
jgi:hypothetical protein